MGVQGRGCGRRLALVGGRREGVQGALFAKAAACRVVQACSLLTHSHPLLPVPPPSASAGVKLVRSYAPPRRNMHPVLKSGNASFRAQQRQQQKRQQQRQRQQQPEAGDDQGGGGGVDEWWEEQPVVEGEARAAGEAQQQQQRQQEERQPHRQQPGGAET